MECLCYVKLWHLCFKQEDQSIEWMTKGQAMVLRVNVLRYKGFVFRQQSSILWEKTGPLHLALVGLTAGRQADEIRLDFAILKILYRLNYLDFYFVYSSAMLFIVLECTSVCFSQTMRILGCVLWCVKSGRHCFSCRSLLLGTSTPNDIYIYIYIR